MASFGIDDPPENVRLFAAILNGKVRLVDKLIKLVGNLDICDERGKTPLICAVCCERDDVRTHLVRMMLRHGCDVNIQDMDGLTALMYACQEQEKLDIVRSICRNKSTNVNICDHSGSTSLMHAINSSNTQAVAVLLEFSINSGLDLKIRNNQSLNALELAVKLQMPDCCQILVKSGAKISSVRDQKGLLQLLDRGGNIDRTSTPLSSRSYSLHKPMSRTSSRSLMATLGRESTFDKDMSRLLQTDDTPTETRPVSYNRNHVSSRLSNERVGIRQQQRRVLTPISRSNEGMSPALYADSALFGNKTRLPSIPSGKKLYLVANPNRYEDQSRVYE